ncbi:MAG: hypothetical protein IJH07_02170 [Ruminococcus sp.]|nr:hypothetical protein [Ruminococcus sp.]
MARMTDEGLEKLLAEYYESEPSKSLTYRSQRAEKTAKPPILSFRRAAVTAAALTLVTVLSVTAYFIFGNKSNDFISVTSSQSSTPSEQGRGGGGAPYASENSTGATERQDGGQEPTVPRSVTPAPTEKGAAQTRETTAVMPTQKPAPAQKPTESAQAPPTDSVSATEPAPTKATEPSNDPPPTEKPTYVSPTDPPWNDNPAPWEPEEPTDSGDDPPEPIVYPTQPEPKNYCYGYIMYDGGSLYCYIEDENGSMMGDPDWCSAQHLAEIVYTYGNGYVLARWSPNEHGVRPSSGYHKYGFVNEYGNTVFEDYVYTQGVS